MITSISLADLPAGSSRTRPPAGPSISRSRRACLTSSGRWPSSFAAGVPGSQRVREDAGALEGRARGRTRSSSSNSASVSPGKPTMNVVRIARSGIALAQLARAGPRSASRSTRRCIRFSTRSLMCCSGMSRYGMIFFAAGQRLDQLVGEVLRVGVQHADPLDAVDLVQLAEQLGQPHAAVEVHAVVGACPGRR